MIQQIKDENPDTPILQIDAGRIFGFGTEKYVKKGEASFMLMEQIGVDAVNLTSIDLLNMGEDFIRDGSQKYHIDLVSANIKFRKETNETPFWKPYHIKTVGNAKVAITGVTSERKRAMGSRQQLEVDDPVESLRQIIPEMKEKADLIILLSYLGTQESKALISQVDGVDFMVIGGDSGYLDYPLRFDDSVLVKVGDQGKYLGKLQVSLSKERVITHYDGNRIALSEHVPDEPTIKTKVDEVLQELNMKAPIKLEEK